MTETRSGLTCPEPRTGLCGDAKLTGFLTETTWRRNGAGLLADISVGLKTRNGCCDGEAVQGGPGRSGVLDSPVLVQSLRVAVPSAPPAAVGDLVVDFGSHFVLQLQDVLKGHGGQFCEEDRRRR